MKILDVCLHISCPKSLEEGLVEHLLEHPEWVPGFSVGAIDGFGRSGRVQGASEQVRGRAGRTYVLCVLDRESAERVVVHLETSLPTPDVFWWMTPVIGSGRFA